jgi:predicted ATP-grasp superfamily ATP-dependent carboligase
VKTDAPVVVLHTDGYGTLGIARTLGRLGVPVYLVARAGAKSPAWPSRYWAKRLRWDFSKPEAESTAFLLEVGRQLRAIHGARPILLTDADWMAIFMERAADALDSQFDFPRAAQPLTRDLADKWEMHRLATANGIPTPDTVYACSLAAVQEFIETTRFPVVLKAADRFAVNGPPNRLVRTPQELLDEARRRANHGPLDVVLQQYIHGDARTVWMCNGYFSSDPSRSVVFTGKKLRQVSSTGVASLAICLPNEAVEKQTRTFMESIGYRGCVGVGWRLDRRDGLYKLLDVNPRVSGVFRLFSGTNDMDVVRACYLDLTGQRAPATVLRPGRKWLLEDDVFPTLRALRDGDLTVRQWLRSLRGVQESAWFAADDPAPAVAWAWDRIRRGKARSEQGSGTPTAAQSAARV